MTILNLEKYIGKDVHILFTSCEIMSGRLEVLTKYNKGYSLGKPRLYYLDSGEGPRRSFRADDVKRIKVRTK